MNIRVYKLSNEGDVAKTEIQNLWLKVVMEAA